MTNPEELQRKFSGPSATVLLLGSAILIVLVALGALFARPAWKSIKQWRARQFHAEAGRALDRGSLSVALDRARLAFQLSPDDPEVLRLNARLLTRAGSEAGLMFWQRVLNMPTATPEDRMAFAEAALALERHDLVGVLVSNLTVTASNSPRLQRIGALYDAGNQRYEKAIERAREAERLEPSNPTNTALLGTLLARSTVVGQRDEARELFRGLAHAPGPFQFAAFQRLVQTDLGERGDREWISDHFAALPQRTPAEEVLMAEARMALDPSMTAQIVSNLIARLPHADVEQLSLVVDALQRRERYLEVLQLTTADRSLQSRSLFRARHDALSALGRVEEAYRLLLTPGAPMPPWDLILAKVRDARGLRNKDRVDAHLHELLAEARGNAKLIRKVADLAEDAGSVEVATSAWKQLCNERSDLALALRSLQRLSDRGGDTWTARDYARRALREGSPYPNLKIEVAYYDLLLGENLELALGEAEREMAAHPKDFFTCAAVALGYLRLGLPAKARDTLDRLVVDEPRVRADALAILAATYGENGLTSRAQETASRIPLNRLRPEERDLVRPWLSPPVPVSSATTR